MPSVGVEIIASTGVGISCKHMLSVGVTAVETREYRVV